MGKKKSTHDIVNSKNSGSLAEKLQVHEETPRVFSGFKKALKTSSQFYHHIGEVDLLMTRELFRVQTSIAEDRIWP